MNEFSHGFLDFRKTSSLLRKLDDFFSFKLNLLRESKIGQPIIHVIELK